MKMPQYICTIFFYNTTVAMDKNEEVIKLEPTDVQFFKQLLQIFIEVFNADPFEIPDERHLEELLKNDPLMVYVIQLDDEIIGGLTAYVLPAYHFKSSEVYIYDLAIKAKFQRRGFGTLLMAAIKDDCRKLGFKEIFVQADVVDDHALKFYRATGGNPESVVHFNYPL